MTKSKKHTSASLIFSMTGFGASKGRDGHVAIQVELKSSNGRYLDPVFRLPREHAAFEGDLRELLAQHIQRGRVEISITREVTEKKGGTYQLHQARFDELFSIYKKTSRAIGMKEISSANLLSDILRRPEVLEFSSPTPDLQAEGKLLVKIVSQAIIALQESRAKEGARLRSDIVSRMAQISSARETIAKFAKARPDVIRAKTEASIQRILEAHGASPDASRLVQEVAHLVDRLDITEELTRLASHLSQFDEVLIKPPVGRKLDFLIQEFVRELNTIGSKVQEAQIQHIIVEAKSEIERIREQIQNLE